MMDGIFINSTTDYIILMNLRSPNPRKRIFNIKYTPPNTNSYGIARGTKFVYITVIKNE